MKISNKVLALVFASVALAACGSGGVTLTDSERNLISGSDSVMRVLTVDSPEDLKILRDTSVDFSHADFKTKEYRDLAAYMVATVTSPEQDGVGIAGPQVGLNRRIVAVQRFDKEGEPFEVYPNIRVTAKRGDLVAGREGCLSVPDTSSVVLRYPRVDIEYYDIASGRMVSETVDGFSAVIFQHETDHLDGVLYIDYD